MPKSKHLDPRLRDDAHRALGRLRGTPTDHSKVREYVAALEEALRRSNALAREIGVLVGPSDDVDEADCG